MSPWGVGDKNIREMEWKMERMHEEMGQLLAKAKVSKPSPKWGSWEEPWQCCWSDCRAAQMGIKTHGYKPLCHICCRVKHHAKSPPKDSDVRLVRPATETPAKQQMRSLQESGGQG